MAELITEDIYLVQIPIPVPLRFVNCYLIRGTNGWSIVDTGFHDEGAEAAWQQAFTALSIQPSDVTTILITHYHPDHYGAAGWLQQLTGAPVYMHDREIPAVDGFWQAGTMGAAVSRFFVQHGLDATIGAQLALHHQSQRALTQPGAELTPLSEGEQILLGDRLFTLLWCPGHSDGLATFWCEADQLLLANDLILQKITPNVTLWPDGRPNPLQDYLTSLERIKALPAKLALTGHRQMITDLAGRAQEIQAHHADRLAKMEALLGTGATGWEMCQRFFQVDQYSLHQIRFAMGETLAHLEYLRSQNRIAFDGRRYHPI